MSSPRRVSDRDARIVELKRQGVTQADIAYRLGVSRNVIAGVLNRARAAGDIQPAPRPTSAPPWGWAPPATQDLSARNVAIVDARRIGVGPAEIAARMGLSLSTVHNVLTLARRQGRLRDEELLPRQTRRSTAERAETKTHSSPAPRPQRSNPVYREPLTEPGERLEPYLPDEPPVAGAQRLDRVQETGGCRWSFGDPKKPGFGFCGAKRASNEPFAADPMPYCGPHRAKAVSRQQPRSAPGGVAW